MLEFFNNSFLFLINIQISKEFDTNDTINTKMQYRPTFFNTKQSNK